MANATGSSNIEYKMVVTPTDEVLPEDSGNLLLPQQETQEKILVSPTPIPTLPPKQIQYNFFNIRVLGVVIGVVFLWIYIRGLRKK
jgi:hypothetical protein